MIGQFFVMVQNCIHCRLFETTSDSLYSTELYESCIPRVPCCHCIIRSLLTIVSVFISLQTWLFLHILVYIHNSAVVHWVLLFLYVLSVLLSWMRKVSRCAECGQFPVIDGIWSCCTWDGLMIMVLMWCYAAAYVDWSQWQGACSQVSHGSQPHRVGQSWSDSQVVGRQNFSLWVTSRHLSLLIQFSLLMLVTKLGTLLKLLNLLLKSFSYLTWRML